MHNQVRPSTDHLNYHKFQLVLHPHALRGWKRGISKGLIKIYGGCGDTRRGCFDLGTRYRASRDEVYI